jgi:predicted DNA-binding transcriptional regulator YafY
MKSQERRLQILLMLQSGRKQISVDYLSEHYNVSRRTIFRDLNFIAEMDVPIAYDPERGYSIPKTYAIPPLMFNEREIAVIRMGLSFIESQSNSDMKDAAKSVSVKIGSVLPESLKPLYTTMENSVIVDPVMNRLDPIKGEGEWYVLSNAISNNNKILINYKKSNIHRLLLPYYLVYYSDHWNLIAYDMDKKGLRNFRLEHINHIEILDETFSRDPKINPDTLFGGFNQEEFCNVVKLKVSESIWSEFYRTIPAVILSTVKSERYYIVDFTFDSLDNLNRLLMRYADLVIPLEPKKLIDLRKSLLGSMVSLVNP